MKELQEKENICNGIYILNVVCFGFSAVRDCSVGGKYVTACLLIRTLQIDGFALAWNAVEY